jgi:hypothetical protein
VGNDKAFRPLPASEQQKAVKSPGSRAMPTLKRHKCLVITHIFLPFL